MASTCLMKPLRLLAARCRPSLYTTGTTLFGSGFRGSIATTTTTTSFLVTRTLSDFGGGGGYEGDGARPTYRLRRPQGSGNRSGYDDHDNDDGRPRRRPMTNRRRGNQKKETFTYGGSMHMSKKFTPPNGLRAHMIDVAFGNYDDDDDNNNKNKNKNESIKQEEDDEDEVEMEALMAELHKQEEQDKANRARWLANSIPPVRVPVIDTTGRSYGRGARKKAHCRVWITPGFGNVTVNRMDLIDYFPRASDRELLLAPLVVTETSGRFDLQCQVRGGGKTGQAGAIRLGVARALQHWNPEYRPPMKKMGYLTRDSRKVEPKRVGRVKARKRPQWNRR